MFPTNDAASVIRITPGNVRDVHGDQGFRTRLIVVVPLVLFELLCSAIGLVVLWINIVAHNDLKIYTVFYPFVIMRFVIMFTKVNIFRIKFLGYGKIFCLYRVISTAV